MKALNTNLVGMCGLCIIVLSSSGLCSVPENDRDAAETDADASAAASILMPDEATIQRTIEEAERTVEERLLRRMEAGAQSKRKLGRKVTPGSRRMQRRNEVVREAVDLLLRRRGLHERPKPDEGVSSLTPLKFNEKEAFSKAVSEILKVHNQGRGKASGGQGKLAHLQELNDAACDDAKPIKCVDSEYRTVSGVCNNLAHPTWGMASIAMRRYTPAQYSDQNGAPRGNLKSASGHCETGDKNTFQKPQHCFPDPSALLPNPRHASTQFHTEATVDDTVYTHMVTQMGQFLDHDITFTPEAEAECCVKGKRVEESGGGEEDCFPIGIPCKEEHFTEDFLGKSERNTAPLQRQYGGSGGSSGCDENSLEFFRSVAFCDGEKVKREQMNGITAFVDASNVYGSSQDVNEALRDMSTGLMLVDDNGLLPEINGARIAGDVRALEMPGLAAMHTLFIREHNRIAKHFIAGGMLSPEEVYLKTRKIVSAEMQNIVYGHYLTAVLGEETMAKSGMKLIAGVHSNYDSNVDPSVFNAFATAAYRFGHSKIQGLIQMISTTTGVATSYNLRDVFFELANYLQNNGDGMEQILNGLIQQAALKNDRFVSEDVTDFLFANNGQHPGSDLIARNIQRGRDHGLPGYNDFRKVCQLPQACTWDSAPDEISPSDWELLSTLYDDPRDIDLFVAGMAETPYAGGIVGRTFNCLLTKQFQNMKFGDRYFFTHGPNAASTTHPFTLDQMNNLLSRNLGDILCDNTAISKVREDVFKLGSLDVECPNTSTLELDLF